MALIEIDLQPSKQQLKWFGLILLAFFALLGTIVYFAFEAHGTGRVLWVVGAVLAIFYYALKPFRLPMYQGWMHLVWPIGWTISHLLLGIIYYLLITPIGWALRISGRDPMQKKRKDGNQTYWMEHRTGADPSRYFRQF